MGRVGYPEFAAMDANRGTSSMRAAGPANGPSRRTDWHAVDWRRANRPQPAQAVIAPAVRARIELDPAVVEPSAFRVAAVADIVAQKITATRRPTTPCGRCWSTKVMKT